MDQTEFVGQSRAMGMVWPDIAAGVRDRFGVNGFVAMRLAHGWSQRDAAEQWSRRWPQDPKTFKNFSYWENWRGPAGYAPSLKVLTQLAELFECAVIDLVCDLGDFRGADALRDNGCDPSPSATARSLSTALEGLWDQLADASVTEVSGSGLLWADRLDPADAPYALLMKLSAGLALAAAVHAGAGPVLLPAAPRTDGRDLAGLWTSRQTGGGQTPGGGGVREYAVVLTAHRGRLFGKSLPRTGGGQLRLYLEPDGPQVSGTWEERTPTRIVSGTVRFQVAPGRRRLTGQWLGFSTGFHAVGGGLGTDLAGEHRHGQPPARPPHPRLIRNARDASLVRGRRLVHLGTGDVCVPAEEARRHVA